jgi:hypothetical protein
VPLLPASALHPSTARGRGPNVPGLTFLPPALPRDLYAPSILYFIYYIFILNNIVWDIFIFPAIASFLLNIINIYFNIISLWRVAQRTRTTWCTCAAAR